ncbi:MAG: zinc ribbon domain-containing protein [Candidatus Helarchaeota archaeon]|nr:zinc ribbon domain-containing protein [Candidatus Helarchaeota archaeon]
MAPKDKREYETDLPVIIGVGIAFLIFAFLSVIPPVSLWINEIGNWLSVLATLCFFPGFIMIAIAIGLSYQNKRLRRLVKRAVISGDYGRRAKLDVIASDFDLSHGDMRRLLTDLRVDGELKVSFDSKTGEVIFPTIGSHSPATISNGHVYCSYCGLQLSRDAEYCPGCGANLH